MANGGHVEIIGATRLAATMNRAAVEMGDQREAFARAGRIVADRARIFAPRRSGRLASTVRPAASKGQADVLAGGAGVVYALVIHFGWAAHSIAANPFVTRAAEQTAPQWHSEFVAGASRVTRKIKGA